MINKKLYFLLSIVIICVSAIIFLLRQGQENQLKPDNLNSMIIQSSDFKNNDFIPIVYTCEGENISPQLDFSKVPQNAKSLALIMYDPDAPRGTFTHWIMWNISPDTKTIFQNSVPPQAVQGLNGANKTGYIGPCPPSGTHRYFFTLYALSDLISISKDSNVLELKNAMSGKIIEEAQIFGLYKKQK